MRTSEGVLTLYKLEIQNLTSKVNILEIQVQHSNSEIISLLETLQGKFIQIIEKDKQIKKLAQEIDAYSKKNVALQDQIKSLKKQLQDDNQSKQLYEIIANLKKDIASLTNKIRMMSLEQQGYQQKIGQYEKKFKQMEETIKSQERLTSYSNTQEKRAEELQKKLQVYLKQIEVKRERKLKRMFTHKNFFSVHNSFQQK